MEKRNQIFFADAAVCMQVFPNLCCVDSRKYLVIILIILEAKDVPLI